MFSAGVYVNNLLLYVIVPPVSNVFVVEFLNFTEPLPAVNTATLPVAVQYDELVGGT